MRFHFPLAARETSGFTASLHVGRAMAARSRVERRQEEAAGLLPNDDIDGYARF